MHDDTSLRLQVLSLHKLQLIETQALSRSRATANFAGHPTCVRCGLKFTAIRRRHHCRQCGNAVCQSCSAQKMKSEDGKLVRVCDDCFASFSETGSGDDDSMSVTGN